MLKESDRLHPDVKNFTDKFALSHGHDIDPHFNQIQ